MRKKDLIAENKRLKDEVEDLKRQLTYAKTQIDIKDICLMLNKEREVYLSLIHISEPTRP